MISTLESISPWSVIITAQKYEYYFNYALFPQLFIDFSSLFLQNDKNAPEKRFSSQEQFAGDGAIFEERGGSDRLGSGW